MNKVEFAFFDAGGGHRASATALCEVIERQGYPWKVQMTNVQELLAPIDIIRRTTGIRMEDFYNSMLKLGWTLGAAHWLKVLQAIVRFYHADEVRAFAAHWRESRPDLVVSVIPHFQRALFESLRGLDIPFVTILTDLADYPPHFWMEPQDQFFICGSEKAVQQARDMGIAPDKIRQSSGMIIHPRFYESAQMDRAQERLRLGLQPDRVTALVMFGGLGSKDMLRIAERLQSTRLPLQLIFICGRNNELAAQLKKQPFSVPVFVEGFTKEMPYYMRLADFFIGKPGPGSISEALVMGLPVIVQQNAWTLPQERYNAQWIREKQVGFVLPDFREIQSSIAQMLQPETFSRFRANIAMLNNRAVFEIPAILDRILNPAAAEVSSARSARS